MTPKRPSRQAVPIGEILDTFLSEAHRDSVRPMERLRASWARITEKKHIQGTRVTQIRQGRVTIEVKSPPLVAELAQFRRRELLDDLQRDLSGEPKVRTLLFRLGAWK